MGIGRWPTLLHTVTELPTYAMIVLNESNCEDNDLGTLFSESEAGRSPTTVLDSTGSAHKKHHADSGVQESSCL